MCGILACIGPNASREQVVKRSVSLQHRGPDDFRCCAFQGGYMAFRRLRVMPECRQPIVYRNIVCMTNGEIYNHKELTAQFSLHRNTDNDCEVVPLLYELLGPSFVQHLRGMFALVLVDTEKQLILAARDHMGIVPLYYGHDYNCLWFASECKAMPCLNVFPPRHVYMNGTLTQWYQPSWIPRPFNASQLTSLYQETYDKLLSAVRVRVPCHAPFACLLSGGLDSSLIASLVRKVLPNEELHTFCIGLDHAPDFQPARDVASFLSTTHHELTFTLQEGLDAIPNVIRHLETYDVTTVRASTPQFLLARQIASLGFKMCLSGEGADEAWGGYLYFQFSPSEEAFHQETVDKLMALHHYDCLRTNKSMAAHGLEVRVPFLDSELLDSCMTLPTKLKRSFVIRDHKTVEKGFLRMLSDRYKLLPKHVAWRQKDQFSDSVGAAWIQGIQAHVQTKGTTEAEWYKALYCGHGYNPDNVPVEETVACSTATGATWVDASIPRDPSAEALKK